MADQNTKVKLTTKDPVGTDKKPKSREFDVEQANKLLALPKSAWKLDDSNWKWNGKELAKK